MCSFDSSYKYQLIHGLGGVQNWHVHLINYCDLFCEVKVQTFRLIVQAFIVFFY
jgi:hypothetical protein